MVGLVLGVVKPDLLAQSPKTIVAHRVQSNGRSGIMCEKIAVSLLLAFSLNTPVLAQDIPGPTEKQVKYSPYPEQNFPNRVFFGDTHLHTSYSTERHDR